MGNTEQQLNPYEAPKTVESFSAEGLTEPAYADGVDLLFTKKYKPPRICLMTGKRVDIGVKPFPCGLITFKIRNSLITKVVVVATFFFYLCSIIILEDYRIKVLGYAVFFGYLIYAAILGQIKFYYIQEIRSREMKKIWKMSLILVPAIGLFVYGATSKNYILAVIGIIVFINFLFILNSRGLFNIKQGEKNYYRLGNIHPDFLEMLPNLPDRGSDKKEPN